MCALCTAVAMRRRPVYKWAVRLAVVVFSGGCGALATAALPLRHSSTTPIDRNPWLLLSVTESSLPLIPSFARAVLASLYWSATNDSTKAQLGEVAQCCDPLLLVHLLAEHRCQLYRMRSPWIHRRRVFAGHDRVMAELRTLMTNMKLAIDDEYRPEVVYSEPDLPTTRVSTSTDHELFLSGGDDDILFEDIVHSSPMSIRSDVRRILLILAGLGRRSIREGQCRLMVEHRALDILADLWQYSRTSAIDRSTAALISTSLLKIISNIVFYGDRATADTVISLGWLWMVDEAIRSTHLPQAIRATKILSNLLYKLSPNNDCLPIFDNGVYQLHDIDERSGGSGDVVFIHGLGGGVDWTWRQKDDTRSSFSKKSAANLEDVPTSCWPKDWLLADLNNSPVRLIAAEYASFVNAWEHKRRKRSKANETRNIVEAISDDLRPQLTGVGVGRKRIVWVTHSMGGIVLKQILCDAASSNDPDERSLLDRTSGIIFLSVPHKGSPLASRSTNSRVLRRLFSVEEAQQLRQDSPYLKALDGRFLDAIIDRRSLSILNICEIKPTTVHIGRAARWTTIVVPESSGYPGYGRYYAIAENHQNTSKPDSKQSKLYLLIRNFIRETMPKSRYW